VLPQPLISIELQQHPGRLLSLSSVRE